MEKDSKEALQVAKELTCKFIETRTVTPGNFAEIFPVIYQVVYDTLHNQNNDSFKNHIPHFTAGDSGLSKTSSNSLSNK